MRISKRDMLRLFETGFHIEIEPKKLSDEDLYKMEASELIARFNKGEMTAEEYSNQIRSLMDVYGKT